MSALRIRLFCEEITTIGTFLPCSPAELHQELVYRRGR
jgi:hypothetical protein